MLRTRLLSALSIMLLSMAGVLSGMAGCSGDEQISCYLPAGKYDVTFTRTSSDCGDVIEPQWTAEREVPDRLRCGNHEETKKLHISGICYETCTTNETVDASSIIGTLSCNMGPCGAQKACKYSADLTTASTQQ